MGDLVILLFDRKASKFENLFAIRVFQKLGGDAAV